jgi:3'-5' exoribonuclease Rv2179c-like domain
VRFFYDTEFLERGPGHPLVLISIGVVAEDGREYFAANADFDPAEATPWVAAHVLPRLPGRPGPSWRPHRRIADEIRTFVGEQRPEWWADFGAYDHVLLCQLFGDMGALPAGWPMFTRDIQQWRNLLGGPELAQQPEDHAHDALHDARWVVRRWRQLRDHAAGLVDTLMAGHGGGAEEQAALRRELERTLVPPQLRCERDE